MKPIETRIYDHYDNLSRSERRLADVVLEHQRDLPSYTATELASHAGVSKATAARLFKSLGYSTFDEAKREVRNARYWGSPLAVVEGQNGEDVPGASLQGVVQADVANLKMTMDSLSAADLEKAVRMMNEAARIRIVGLRNSFGLAHLARHYLGFARADVQAMPVGGASWGEEVASLSSGDLMFAIGFRRRPKILARLLQTAQAMGVGTVLLTDMSATMSAKYADVVLRCHSKCPAPFSSFTAAITVINYLAWALIEAQGPNGIDRLRQIDDLITSLDDVSQPAKR
ncbi:MurR/RpiR family transcriptional regulator [Shumkonia mesophila]|uniref:MurR/RpiR family transcriptional regulator n=1 Tax=Shumkonia mesophila TaxID=2838854 RepID=UPI0029346DFD|nr:MurR/RpiR family transcriptional regulator [Shumkonia mesophila]